MNSDTTNDNRERFWTSVCQMRVTVLARTPEEAAAKLSKRAAEIHEQLKPVGEVTE
jgi:hypothetical protein